MRDLSPQSDCVITGYACRLPGAASANAFWDLLYDGRDAIGEIGSDRFAIGRYLSTDLQEAGTSYTFQAGLIENLWEFDPGFFGFSPREAKQMDPQQRLLLQVAWEAIEHAGLRPSLLTPGRTGVYIGASASDYSTQFFNDPARVDAPFMLGNTLSILSNRISYVLDLTGPSYTVDTACSSSLYALDQARRALDQGEIDTAIVGGVNVLLSPISFIGFSRAGMLSPKGRCAFLDANADGYVRAEGAVVFVLRRAEVAAQSGDRVRGRLITTGIGTDGRTTGLALPSAAQQAKLMARLRDEAGINVDDIAFAEAHGTGTQAGDLAEAISLGEVYGSSRRAPLPIGSAKTNVGHLEPASGLVGLLKAQLALEHGVLPATLNLVEPNRAIDCAALKLSPATAPITLQRREAPWLAVINSFGFGGANAHAVLEEARPAATEAVEPSAIRHDPPLLLSAASTEALKALAREWAQRLSTASPSEGMRLINQAAWRRERMAHTLLATGASPSEIGAGLDRHLATMSAPTVITGTRAGAGRTVFVFSGNGAQWPGMGRHLFETDPVFRRAFLQTSELFRAAGGLDLAALLSDAELAQKLDRATIGQALLFAIQSALVQCLADRGLEPDAVAGHSVGEVAAAWCAGALSLGDAVQVIQARASTLETLHGTGGMAAVLSGAETLEPILASFLDEMPQVGDITLAADNNPRSTTISGPVEALEAFIRFSKSRRLAVKRLAVPYPYHSAAVEPLREDLMACLSGIRPREPRIDFFSSTTGQRVQEERLDPTFWWRNTRSPVRFRQAVAALTQAGCRTFVEIGPRPVLQNYVLESATEAGASAQYVPTLEQGRHQNADAAQIAARAIAAGTRHDEARVFGPPVPYEGGLPAYVWQQAAFKAEPTGAAVNTHGAGAHDHPLLGWCEHSGKTVWHNHLSLARQPWLADHAIDGAAIFPAAGYAELVLAAGAATFTAGDNAGNDLPGLELEGLDILQPLVIEGSQTLRTTIDRETGTVTIESAPYPGGGTWILHARARVRLLPDGEKVSPAAPVPAASGVAIEAASLYAAAETLGLTYGPAFRCFAGGKVADRMMTLDLVPPRNAPEGCLLAPGLLDGAMHGLLALIASEAGLGLEGMGSQGFLPVRMGRLQLHRPGRTPARARLVLEKFGARSVKASMELDAENGAPIARLSDLRLRAKPTGRRAPLRPRFWRQVIEPRSGRKPEVTLPETWADPARRLAALELVARHESQSEDPGMLLADAACRRLAWDTVTELAGPDGRVDASALTVIAENAYPLLRRLLAALEEDALFIRDVEKEGTDLAGVLAKQCDYPEFNELLQGLHDEAPDYVEDLHSLAELADLLPYRLRTGLGDDAAGARSLSLKAPRQWAALETALSDLADHWPADQRLTVLIVGMPPRDVLTRLLDHPALTRLTLTDPDSDMLELMTRDLPRHPAFKIRSWDAVLAENLPRDVVVSGDRFSALARSGMSSLAGTIAPRGLLLGVHTIPDLLDDLSSGLAADWWNEPTHVPKRRRTGRTELLAQLAQAKFVAPKAQPLEMTGRQALLVSGMGAAEQADAPEVSSQDAPTPIILYPRGDRSEAPALMLRSAMVARGARDVQLSVLTPLLGVPDAPWESIVLLAPREQTDTAAMTAAAIGEIQALLARLPAPVRLWLVIPGGCPGAPENFTESAAMAALWGYGRTLINEYPELEIRLVDPGPPVTKDDKAWASRLASVIMAPGPEREVLTTPRGLSVPRVEPVRSLDHPSSRSPSKQRCAKQLATSRIGSLDDLYWQDIPRRVPGDKEVEIAVHAAGLNFRDVMWAQGLLPEEALEHGFAGPGFGMECAGVVVRAGAASGFAEGERVVGFASQALASHVTAPASTVMRIPAGLDFEAAASLPVVFVTAYYALDELARVTAGERVLIHGGAGGVGLAALQIARSKGARIFATAGTPAKRRILRALGAEAVFDSRSLAFADEVRTAAGGGVDVVLNALAGEAMERSIGCLAPFGRFVELGKRDFFADTKIGLYPFRRNLSYFAVDLDEFLAARPGSAHRLLDTFSRTLAMEAINPLPYQVWEAGDVTQAFRRMQRAEHVGKIVIRPPRQSVAARPVRTRNEVTIRGGWLIAGGTGGFGMATAAALAARGAEKLWLASRTGRPDEKAAQCIAGLVAQGIAVETLALDITDGEAVSSALARIRKDQVALRGVLHSAMVLRDRLACDLTPEDIAAVLAPKITGAEHLDRETRGQGLDHFILYSSAVTLFGNPRQAPYVAANMALERIAQARRAAGEPALAIGWGAIGDAGYLDRDMAARGLLEHLLGEAFLSEAEALSALTRWQEHDAADDPAEASVGFARMPWPRLANDLPILATPLYERLDEPYEALPAAASVAELRAELSVLPPREALNRVVALLVTETAAVLHQPEAEVDPSRPLGEIGFDSLMAVELRIGLEEKIGLSLPLLSLADATTLTDVAVRILHAVRDVSADTSEEEEILNDLTALHAVDESMDAETRAALLARARDVERIG